MRGWSRKKKELQEITNQVNIENERLVKEARTAINVEGTTKFCDEFSKALEYIYLGGTCDENHDSNFMISHFSRQTFTSIDNSQNPLFARYQFNGAFRI